jgi:hypothetical protein
MWSKVSHEVSQLEYLQATVPLLRAMRDHAARARIEAVGSLGPPRTREQVSLMPAAAMPRVTLGKTCPDSLA